MQWVQLHPLVLRLTPYVLRRQVTLYRGAQATYVLFPRWPPQRAPEVILYHSVQAIYIFFLRWK